MIYILEFNLEIRAKSLWPRVSPGELYKYAFDSSGKGAILLFIYQSIICLFK